MSDPAKAELLRSLGKVVRGLSALFWGLPLTLVVYVQSAQTDWLGLLGNLGIVPSSMATALLLFGLVQMRSFQPQERVWLRSLDRATFIMAVNVGLAPFLFWWHRLPAVPLFAVAVTLLISFSLLFLFYLNQLLNRLTAMLPDEALRHETQMFTKWNRAILLAIPLLILFRFVLARVNILPGVIDPVLRALDPPVGLWLLIFMLLLPLAMTMAMIWKIKETIFASLFAGR